LHIENNIADHIAPKCKMRNAQCELRNEYLPAVSCLLPAEMKTLKSLSIFVGEEVLFDTDAADFGLLVPPLA
jgi:hypothetical protein